MDLLVIGGTQFVGRAIVDAALAGGHRVTLFHRGRTNRGLFDGVEEILGDREGDLRELGTRTWDAVVDSCGYVPRVVARSAGALRELSGRRRDLVLRVIGSGTPVVSPRSAAIGSRQTPTLVRELEK